MKTLHSVLAALATGSILLVQAADDTAAMALAKKGGCLTCHAVDKKKEGPSFKDVAAKYRGKADAEAVLVRHVTTNPKIRVDGREETHSSLQAKSDADVKNVVGWILSR